MNFKEYYALSEEFRMAFERLNGELPRGEHSEHIRNVWLNMAETWFRGWELAIEHASELRPPVQTLMAPAPTRTFVVTVAPGALPVIHEPKLPGSAQTEAMHVPMREYVSSLEDYRPENNVFQQEANPWPVPPPPMPAPRQGHAPAAPVTAAEAAAASVQAVCANEEERSSVRVGCIIFLDEHDTKVEEAWLIQRTKNNLTRIGIFRDWTRAEEAAQREHAFVLKHSSEIMSEGQKKFWRKNKDCVSIHRDQGLPEFQQ